MPEISYDKAVIKDLMEAKLPWKEVKRIISGYKDDDRFVKYVELLQEKVPWQEKAKFLLLRAPPTSRINPYRDK